MFSKLADFIMKHSKAIIAIWLVLLVCAVPFAIKSNDVLDYDLTKMSGTDGYESVKGQALIDQYFPSSLEMDEIVVIEYSTSAELTSAKILGQQLTVTIPEKMGASFSATPYGQFSKGDANVSGIYLVSIACSDDSVNVADKTGDIRNAVSDAKNACGVTLSTYVTGNDAIAYDTEKSSMEDISKIDPLSVALIFILLALFFFALVTAIVPPAVVGLAYGIVLSLIYAIGSFMDIYYITSVLVLISMLGAGSDYAIFIITRYREERRGGADHDTALKSAIEWAGESVFTSGLSVIIGFGALMICSFSMVSSMGLILAIGIVVALFAALTFIPSLLNLIGEKIFWPSKVSTYVKAAEPDSKGVYATLCKISKGYFDWVAKVTRKYAIPIIIAAIIISVPTFYIYFTTDDSSDMISIMPKSESSDGLDVIMENAEGGMIMPTYVVIETTTTLVDSVGAYTIPGVGTSIPYVKWSAAGLTVTASGPTGAVPAMMQISNTIAADYPEIVGTASGTTSWTVLYLMTSQTLAAKGITPTPAVVNAAIYSQLPALVTGNDSFNYLWNNMLKDKSCDSNIIPIDPTSPTVSNVMDYILNVQTGILSPTGMCVNMTIVTTEKPMSDNTMKFINDLKDDFHGTDGYDSTYSSFIKASYVAGSSAMMGEISTDVGNQFNVIRIVVIVLLIILLFLILGCYLTPIRAVLSIMVSIIWTIALTHVVFGNIMNVPVLWLVPIVLFVVLLGLGMDYDIFLTTRIRENKLKGENNHDAIDNAVKKAGSVITLCALLMGGTFLTMVLANSSMLQEFGFALGVGILIDGLFMVTYVAPAIMHLMGDWSWKGPKFLAKRRTL